MKIYPKTLQGPKSSICRDGLKAKISEDIRQGCGLCPVLTVWFNLRVEFAMKELMETINNEIIINDLRYKTIRFADNISLLELQDALHRMNKILKD